VNEEALAHWVLWCQKQTVEWNVEQKDVDLKKCSLENTMRRGLLDDLGVKRI